MSAVFSFNRLCSDSSPRRPAQSARLSNVEVKSSDLDEQWIWQTAEQPAQPTLEAMQPYKIPTSGTQPQGASRERGGCYAMADSGVCPFRDKCKFSHKPEAMKATRESEGFKQWQGQREVKTRQMSSLVELTVYLDDAETRAREDYAFERVSSDPQTDYSDGAGALRRLISTLSQSW